MTHIALVFLGAFSATLALHGTLRLMAMGVRIARGAQSPTEFQTFVISCEVAVGFVLALALLHII